MEKVNLLSIYIHTPFCESRCSYCDFNTYVGFSSHLKNYIHSVIEEIDIVSAKTQQNSIVHTVYFGGGTPTIMQSKQLNALISNLHKRYKITQDVEVSIEANPCNLVASYLSDLVESGFNRLSLGMQSADDEELKLLGRRHTFEDVRKSMSSARKANFQNINLDLIFGIPLQTLETFRKSLLAAISLEPDHLSLYALSLEEHTPLAVRIREKKIPPPNDDMAADMYEFAMDCLKGYGYQQYEISNWAREEKFQCRHNIQYWKNMDYIGFGAGAHSHYNHRRWENILTIIEYINQIHENKKIDDEYLLPATKVINDLDLVTQIQETIMMGLRLTDEGLNILDFHKRFGMDINDLFDHEIKTLVNQKLIERIYYKNNPCIRLTRKGRLLGNQVFLRFLDDVDINKQARVYEK